jgi:hypothetical protein
VKARIADQEEATIATQKRDKHILTATNQHTTTENAGSSVFYAVYAKPI